MPGLGDPSAPPPRDEDVVILVPAYNEALTIGAVVAGLRERWRRVVVIDDGSGDATPELAAAAGAALLRHLVNRGQGAALQTGIAWALQAGAEVVVTCDADGQHRAEDIDRLVRPILLGEADVVLGSRFLGGAERLPAPRRLLLEAAVRFTRLTSGMPVTDAHNGLRAFSRRAAAALDLRQDRMAHASELLDQIRQAGWRWCEVPVVIRYTAYSRAKGQPASAALGILVDYLLGRLLD